jgi:hypothetical protein
LMWTDRVDGKCCVVGSFVELLWTDRIDGECFVVVVAVADSAELPHSSSDSEDEVVVSFAGLLWTDGKCCVVVSFADSADEGEVPHSSSKSTSDSDRSNATLRVTCDDGIVSGFVLCLCVVVVVERKSVV